MRSIHRIVVSVAIACLLAGASCARWRMSRIEHTPVGTFVVFTPDYWSGSFANTVSGEVSRAGCGGDPRWSTPTLWELVAGETGHASCVREIRVDASGSDRMVFRVVTECGLEERHVLRGTYEGDVFEASPWTCSGLPPLVWSVGDRAIRVRCSRDGDLVVDYCEERAVLVGPLPVWPVRTPVASYTFPRVSARDAQRDAGSRPGGPLEPIHRAPRFRDQEIYSTRSR